MFNLEENKPGIKEEKKSKNKVHIINMVLLIVILALTGLSFYKITNLGNSLTGSATAAQTTSDVKLDFYVMSFCPYGNQAEEAIEPVYRLMKDKISFNPHYVVYANYHGGEADYCIADGKYCSMHGIQELNQDIRELCAAKYLGMDKYFDFILAINKKCSSVNADTCWEQVAKDLKLDVNKIRTCQEKEAVELAANEFNLNQQLGVSGSPTVFINDLDYNGGRTPQSYLDAVCAKFTTKPAQCSQKLAGATASPTGDCG